MNNSLEMKINAIIIGCVVVVIRNIRTFVMVHVENKNKIIIEYFLLLTFVNYVKIL